VLLSIKCKHICRLLLISWIDQQSPACHVLQVGILCANIDVDSVGTQLVIVAVHAPELVEVEVLSRLDEYWQWEFKELAVGNTMLFHKRAHLLW
jgi:hypothetical protein